MTLKCNYPVIYDELSVPKGELYYCNIAPPPQAANMVNGWEAPMAASLHPVALRNESLGKQRQSKTLLLFCLVQANLHLIWLRLVATAVPNLYLQAAKNKLGRN